MMDDAKQLGLRLRNVLRHKKSHQWVGYEYFYANIDRTLLAGENDFRACLKESFPHLKSKNLTRNKWRSIRRSMGRPRRFSQAFLAQEREQLRNKRQKIRQLQQQKVVDVSYFRDLPEQIPLSLVIGTRVTALIREPQYGLFKGVIDAVDTKSHGYRITFDREEIGTHTVPDYEVLSLDSPEFLPLSSFQTRIKPRKPILKSPKFLEVLGHQVAEALKGKLSSVNNNQTFVSDNEDGGGGQYPIKLLALMVHISKMLTLKRKRIHELKSMNDEVERLHSIEQKVPLELKKSYASTILDLERLNTDLDVYLKAVLLYSNELSNDTNCVPDPDSIRQKCASDAKDLVDDALRAYKISNESSISMISHMMTLMFHLKTLSATQDNSLHVRALNDTIREYKINLKSEERGTYEDDIEIHVNYIKNV